MYFSRVSTFFIKCSCESHNRVLIRYTYGLLSCVRTWLIDRNSVFGYLVINDNNEEEVDNINFKSYCAASN